jgi:hypothetical protein
MPTAEQPEIARMGFSARTGLLRDGRTPLDFVAIRTPDVIRASRHAWSLPTTSSLFHQTGIA